MFECKFDAVGPVNIQWFKGDKELKSQFRHKIGYDDNTGVAKLFVNTVFPDDADVYTCRLTNPQGEVVVSSAKLEPLARGILI